MKIHEIPLVNIIILIYVFFSLIGVYKTDKNSKSTIIEHIHGHICNIGFFFIIGFIAFLIEYFNISTTNFFNKKL